MMERVQITGQAGDGQYYDNKGRLLYAMGDINITPGMWVWTNGKTIYGHQTAGEQPTPPVNVPVLPVIDIRGNIIEIDVNGNIKPFIQMTKLCAYVGDANHAYGAIASGEHLHWYNLITLDDLGIFDCADACISNEGTLLTINATGSLYIDTKTNGAIDTNNPLMINTDIGHGQTSDIIGFTDLYKPNAPPWEKNEFIPHEGEIIDKHGEITIRENGKIIYKYSLDVERNRLKEYLHSESKKIHDANGGKPRTSFFSGDRPRPNACVSFCTSSALLLRIYSDKTFLASINISGDASAYPGIAFLSVLNNEVPIKMYDAGWFDCKKADIPNAIVSGSYTGNLNDYIFHVHMTKPKHILAIGKVIDWCPAYIHGTICKFVGNQKNDFFYQAVLSLGDIGVVVGPATVTNAINNAYPKAKGIAVKAIKGYDVSYLQLDDSAYNWDYYANYLWWQPEYSGWDTWHPGWNGSTFLRIFNNRTTSLIRSSCRTYPANDTARKYWDAAGCKSSQILKAYEGSYSGIYKLVNGFKAIIKSENSTYIDAPKYIEIIDSDGKKIINTIDDSSLYTFFNFQWWNTKVCKLKFGKYVILVPNNNLGIIYAGKTEHPDIYPAMTFTLIPFKNRNLLKKNIIKIAGGQ